MDLFVKIYTFRGFLRDSQDAKTNLTITAFPRGLIAKPPAPFFFLWTAMVGEQGSSILR
jgi:hypothetical protein